MAEYVDGFVVPVKKDKVDAYRGDRRESGRAVARVRGATPTRSALPMTSSRQVDLVPAAASSSRTTRSSIFSWITYESKAKRDEANAKVMADPRMKEMMDVPDMPMDPPRMFFGGFEVIVDA